MVIFQGPGIIGYPNSPPTKQRNETTIPGVRGHASDQAPPRQLLESLESPGFRRSADRLSNDPWKASATIPRPWIFAQWTSMPMDSKWPQKDVFRFLWWFDAWWFSSHERHFPKFVVFQCDLGTFRSNPTNHAISKLLVWRSKRTLLYRVKPPLFEVQWFSGKVTKITN